MSLYFRYKFDKLYNIYLGEVNKNLPVAPYVSLYAKDYSGNDHWGRAISFGSTPAAEKYIDVSPNSGGVSNGAYMKECVRYHPSYPGDYSRAYRDIPLVFFSSGSPPLYNYQPASPSCSYFFFMRNLSTDGSTYQIVVRRDGLNKIQSHYFRLTRVDSNTLTLQVYNPPDGDLIVHWDQTETLDAEMNEATWIPILFSHDDNTTTTKIYVNKTELFTVDIEEHFVISGQEQIVQMVSWFSHCENYFLGDYYAFAEFSYWKDDVITPVFSYTGPFDAKVKGGNIASFEITNLGVYSTYQWYSYDAGVTGILASETDSSYTVGATGTLDGMGYYCVMEDLYGDTHTSPVATLTVAGSMGVVNPTTIYYYKGETGVFTDGATGGIGGYTYQWQRKDV